MNNKTRECMWCHRDFEGLFIFCDECMEDDESFQDRWNIAAQIEGEKFEEGMWEFCSECDISLHTVAESKRGVCNRCSPRG